MLSQDIIHAAARRLHEAEKARSPVRQISLDHPEITIEDAYAIQATLVATGFSLLLETLVVQILERLYGRVEIVESLLSDWNLTVLRRVVRRRRNPVERRIDLDRVEKGCQIREMIEFRTVLRVDRSLPIRVAPAGRADANPVIRQKWSIP